MARSECPIARSLERVGEWWSILILRDAMNGLSRFDEFQRSLGIAPNMLARRLARLVASGLFEKHRYSARPPRYEYRLTPRGRDFRPVLLLLLDWGNRHFAPQGPSVLLADAKSGEVATPLVVDAKTGRPLTDGDYVLVAGPAAGRRTRQRLGTIASRRELRGQPPRISSSSAARPGYSAA
jgi:DNA-binding HxlR family transcriptional regulator